MNVDQRVPSGAPSASAALLSRRTRRAATETRGNSPAFSSPNLSLHRRSSLSVQAQAIPHRPGSAYCLCPACHLHPAVFPRRQDGRILLPVPWDSEREGPPPSSQIPSVSISPYVPNVAEATRGDNYTSGNWGRRSDGSSTRNASVEKNTDRGEGTSRGLPRLSGPGVAPSEEPYGQPDHLNVSFIVDPKRRRSNTDEEPRPNRYPKPYIRPQEQGFSGHVGFEHMDSTHRLGIDSSAIFLNPAPPSAESSRRDPHGNKNAGPYQSFDSRIEMGNPTSSIQILSRDPPAEPVALTRAGAGPIPRPASSISNQRQTQSSSRRTFRNESPVSSRRIGPPRLPSSSLAIAWDPSRTTHFSPYSHTPENLHEAAGHTADPSHQPFLSAPIPAQSSFTWRGDEGQESAIRFEEPVVHEPTQSSDYDSQVEIKWDTERKRRQGYSSHTEEGSEKSNFRLYNQSSINFGS